MKLIQGSFAKRALMVGMLAGSGFLAASTYAMSDGDSAPKGGCEARHGHQGHSRWEEHRTKHLSVLKEELKLAPGQEAAWNTFAGASQPAARAVGVDRQAQRDEFAKLNTPQRLDKILAMSDLRHARVLERVQATKAFYAQLSPEQRSVFDAEAMPGRHGGQHHPHQS